VNLDTVRFVFLFAYSLHDYTSSPPNVSESICVCSFDRRTAAGNATDNQNGFFVSILYVIPFKANTECKFL